MKRRLIVVLLALLTLGVVSQSVFAQTAELAIPHLVANTSFLNIRSGDGPQYTVIVTVVGGTDLPVLGKDSSGEWFLVTTPVGPGWVDQTFTLARGDFSNIPVITPTVGTSVQLPTPLTIGLPVSPNADLVTVEPETTLQTTTVAEINVISVNLRTQPAEDAPAIGLIFRYVTTNPQYAVVGYAVDDTGIPWVAIVVPGLGTGWVEQPKTTIEQGTLPAAALTSTFTASAVSGVVPVPQIQAAHLIVNTSYQNIRSGPGVQYTSIAVVPGGSSLDVVGVTSDTSWYLVQGTFGQGWISSQYVLFRGTFSDVPIIHTAY